MRLTLDDDGSVDKDDADQTWTPVTAASIAHAVVYVERVRRDPRWLWLRRKTVTEIVTVIDCV